MHPRSLALRGWTVLVATILLFGMSGSAALAEAPQTLPGTQPLDWEGDIASRLVDECDAFLLRRLEDSIAKRPDHWVPADAPPEQRKPSVERLKKALGLIDERVSFEALEFVATTKEPSLVATLGDVQVHRVRWPVFEGVNGEGLLFLPKRKPSAYVIAIPDAEQTPEEFCQFNEDRSFSQFSFCFDLAGADVAAVVPALISRDLEKRKGRANLTHREYLHRPAFELGRTMTGYEVQKVLALVDWMSKENAGAPIGVAGHGEGGRIALFAAAVDDRIDSTLVSDSFGDQQDIWKQPLDRQVVGLLREFGDAELALMISPRTLVIEEPAHGPASKLPGEGGAPSDLESPSTEEATAEFARLQAYREGRDAGTDPVLNVVGKEKGPPPFRAWGTPNAFYPSIGVTLLGDLPAEPKLLVAVDGDAFAKERLARQIAELDRFNQRQLETCEFRRDEFLKGLDTSSVEAYERSVENYRTIFREQVIGKYDLPVDDFNPRTRKAWETEKWVGYEVVLDVFDGVFAYGALLLPKDLKEGERRPVVVCQHGLEGRPTDTFLNDHQAYHDFAGKLAERGFVVFAPQNLYIFQDRFRTLQRKSYPLGTTLFSIIVPQHQQIVDWLQTQPFVDAERIGFYGLSYGGKSAMRIPALVTDYKLSICSADFNEWVRKNASTRHDFSYVWTGEYEIFEFDLGNTFNYAEMAALIAPRPFMVERGHFDGVGTDEWVAYEYAKVRRLYAAKLGIPDRTEIEFFVGPHTINGQGTYAFLHKHLDWPAPERTDEPASATGQ